MKKLLFISLILPLVFACDFQSRLPKDELEHLSNEEKDYIQRFNIVAKDIRDFPPPGKDIEKYFYIFKNVTRLEDAKIFIFGEDHTHAANKLWSASVINRLIGKGDVVLFEGAQAGEAVVTGVAEQIVSSVFGAREYEKRKSHKNYKPSSLDKLRAGFVWLFFKTKQFLSLDIINFSKATGFYWDLTLPNGGLDPSKAKRNKAMVQTIEDKRTVDNKVFVIAGARHTPHYEFADFFEFIDDPNYAALLTTFLAYPRAHKDKLNAAFYDSVDALTFSNWTTTRVVFDYLKDKDYAILIPKNLPGARDLEKFYPKK